MKRTGLILCVTALLAFTASSAAPANDKYNKKPKGPASAVYAKYDLDHNGKLNVEEGDAIRRDFAKNPDDPLLKPFDTDHDGTLSDAEIMAIPATKGGRAPKKDEPGTKNK